MHSRRGRDGCGRLRALLEERYGDPVVPLSRWGREVARWAITTNLPRPQVEYRIVDAAGDFVAQVDLAWPEQRVALELDSVQFHLNRTSFERDPRRRNQVIAHGWDLRTCTWDMWVHDRPTLRRQLWEALMLHSRTA